MKPSEIKLLLLFLIALIIGGTYFFYYTKTMEQVKFTRAENEELAKQAAVLEDKLARKAEVLADTEAKEAIVQALLLKFPSKTTQEKLISFLIDWEKQTKIELPTVSFSMNVPFGGEAPAFQEPAEGQEGAEAETPFVPPALIHTGTISTLQLNFRATYENLKNALDYVYDFPDKMGITNIVATYNAESGMLEGSLSLDVYAMDTSAREYEPPVFDGTAASIANDIFR